MKTIVHTYVDINGITLNCKKYYTVTFSYTSKKFLFNKCIKTIDEKKEVPFVFDSLEIAKDFCELNPTYNDFYLYVPTHDELGKKESRYYTYELVLNSKVNAYIIWHYESTKLMHNGNIASIKPIDNYPVVKGFVLDICKSIKLNDYNRMNCVYDVTIENSDVHNKLSEIYSVQKDEQYHFELVEK